MWPPAYEPPGVTCVLYKTLAGGPSVPVCATWDNDLVQHSPPHAPTCRCLSCANEAIRRLAARVAEWTPTALAELDVLYRMWTEAGDGEDEPAAA